MAKKTLNQQIDDFTSQFNTVPDGKTPTEARLYTGGWNWDEKWDGWLVEKLQEFESKTPLRVGQFWRTKKVRFRSDKNLTKKEIVDHIMSVLDENEFYQIKFANNGVTVWMQPVKSNGWYR